MEPNDSPDESKIDNAGRGKPGKERPWCWQEKAGRRMIRTMFDSRPKQMSSALSVYDALTEIASDEQRNKFEAAVAQIASYAGVSPSTVWRLLPLLEELSLITIRRNDRPGSRLKAPSTYTLLPIGHGDASIRQQPSRKRPRDESPSGKSKKNDDEKRARTREAAPASAKHNGASSFLFLNLEEAKKHRLWKKFESYCKSQPDGSPTLKGFKTWLELWEKPKPHPMPVAKRNKIINELNRQKQMIYRTFPDGKLAPWAVERLASIEAQLKKL
jgi:hypothetical protein